MTRSIYLSLLLGFCAVSTLGQDVYSGLDCKTGSTHENKDFSASAHHQDKYFVCVDSRWREDDERFDKEIDTMYARVLELTLDMRTKVVPDAEFVEAVGWGTSLITFSKRKDWDSHEWTTAEATRALDELYAQQFRLRTIQACGGKKECAE